MGMGLMLTTKKPGLSNFTGSVRFSTQDYTSVRSPTPGEPFSAVDPLFNDYPSKKWPSSPFTGFGLAPSK
jgi:hypothetical protein